MFERFDKIMFFAIAFNDSFEFCSHESLKNEARIATVKPHLIDRLCADPASQVLVLFAGVVAQFPHVAQDEPPRTVRIASTEAFDRRAHGRRDRKSTRL